MEMETQGDEMESVSDDQQMVKNVIITVSNYVMEKFKSEAQ